MTVLDYFVLLVVAASVASGVTRGILKGIISIVSTVAGLLAAARFYDYSAILFRTFVSTEREARMLGFVAIFLGVLLVGALLTRWLRRGMKRTRLSWVDRVMGALFGIVRGWLICSVVYLTLTAFPVKLEAVEQAKFAPVLLEGTLMISYLTSPEMREQFLKGYDAIQELWRNKE